MNVKPGDLSLVRTLTVLAALFFALSIIHFQILRRVIHTRSVGMIYALKSLGYGPSQLFAVFSQRVGLIWLSTVLIVLIISLFLLRLFGEQLSPIIQIENVFSVPMMAVLGLAALGLVILSTPWPAIRSITQRPVDLKQGAQTSGSFQSIQTRLILIFKFALTTFFLLGLVEVNKAIGDYLNAERGYAQDQRFFLTGWRNDHQIVGRAEDAELVQKVVPALTSEPSIEDYTLSSWPIPGGTPPASILTGLGPDGQLFSVPTLYVAPSFFRFLEIETLAGRVFDETALTSAPGQAPGRVIFPLVISQAAASAFGFMHPDDAIGTLFGMRDGRRAEVIGVVNNIVTNRPGTEAEPLLYYMNPQRLNQVYVRTQTAAQTHSILREKLAYLAGGDSLTLTSLTQALRSLLYNDLTRRALLSVLCLLLCLITLISAYNLFLLIIHDLRKDLVIRQVYGYGFWNLVAFLSGRLLPPVFVGILAGVIGSFLLLDLILTDVSSPALSALATTGLWLGATLLGIATLAICLITTRLNVRIGMRVLNDSGLTS